MNTEHGQRPVHHVVGDTERRFLVGASRERRDPFDQFRVHVLECLWSAAWSFFGEGDPAAEDWVRDRALAVLSGQASIVAAGWPIATGVIEGACRHLVKDRMDITGARWGLNGAEAVLKLRALRTNNCWDDYWAFHLDREHQRVHQARYHNDTIPHAA